MKNFKKTPRFGGGGGGDFRGGGGFNRDRGGSRGGFGGARRDSGRPLEMHEATCAQCKKTCEVPFRPNGTKPVYCKDCFGGKPDSAVRSFSRDSAPRPSFRPERESRGENLAPQIEMLASKIDALTAAIKEMQSSSRKEAPAKEVVEKPAKKAAKKKKSA